MFASFRIKGSNLRVETAMIPMAVTEHEFSICDDGRLAAVGVIVTLTREELVYLISKIDEERRADRDQADPEC